ncbi:molybdenum cofactor guanylyltransferase MobA [Marinobacteraceae bacterium S3BR75-40.1]
MTLKLAGLVLAGGEGRRMGGVQKGLLEMNGQPFAARLAAVLRPHVERVVISANRDRAAYRKWGDAVVDDGPYAGQGPLAGLVAGLHWACEAGLDGVVVLPCDTPRISSAWVERLLAQSGDGKEALFSRVAGELNPLHCYLPCTALPKLEQRLQQGELRIKDLLGLLGGECVDFDDLAEEFLNVNRPADRDQLSS